MWFRHIGRACRPLARGLSSANLSPALVATSGVGLAAVLATDPLTTHCSLLDPRLSGGVHRPGRLSDDGLSFDQLSKLRRTTDFNNVELAALWAEFLSIDKSADHEISGEEFIQFYMHKFKLDHGQMAQLYKIFDRDRGGTISFDEFCITLSKLVHGTPVNRLGFFFLIADSDNSHFIDKMELMSMLYVLFRLSSEFASVAEDVVARDVVATEIIKEADENNDGVLSASEIKKWAEKGSANATMIFKLLDRLGQKMMGR